MGRKCGHEYSNEETDADKNLKALKTEINETEQSPLCGHTANSSPVFVYLLPLCVPDDHKRV